MIKKHILPFLICSTMISLSWQTKKTEAINRSDEARKAFTYLMDVRNHPEKYYSVYPFLKNAKISKVQLKWNDTLQKVAEAKAMDMASRNYFDHVDKQGYGINYRLKQAGYALEAKWTKTKSENYFESICAGMKDSEDAIRLLLIDEGVPSLGHRNHLLGIEDWNASLYDIGIGYVEMPDEKNEYNSYLSLIIAKHHW